MTSPKPERSHEVWTTLRDAIKQGRDDTFLQQECFQHGGVTVDLNHMENVNLVPGAFGGEPQGSLLHLCVTHNRIAPAIQLIESGARVDLQTTGMGRTPLHYAARGGRMEITIMLLQKGSDVNMKDKLYGNTALHYAVMNGSLDVTETLLAAGADPSMADQVNGRSALHYAVMNGHVGVVEMLLGFGADPSMPDQYGRTPLQLLDAAWVVRCVSEESREGIRTLLQGYDDRRNHVKSAAKR